MTHTALTDVDLLRQLRGGTASAFQALYRRHQGPLYRFALLRCGSPDTAADIVQDVFLGLLAGSFTYDATRGQLLPFLFGVARNLAMKHDEPRHRTESLQADDDGGESEAELLAEDDAGEPLQRLLSNELAEQVRQALARIAPHYRDALILYELHELSYAEIAQVCDVDIGTVRSRLSRARALLARRLAPSTMHAA